MKDPIVDIIQSMDTAFSSKTSADYTVIITAGRGKDHKIYLLNMFRQRVEWPDLVKKSEELYRLWNPGRVIIENKASGQSLIQELKTKGIPVLASNPDGDKYRRASAVTGMVEAGMVHLPLGEPWVDDFIEELADFPESPHDDIVDAFSMLMSYYKRSAGRVISGERKEDHTETRRDTRQETVTSSKIVGGSKRSNWS